MVKDAFELNNDEEFAKKYGRKKPDVNDEIIFSCLLGGRSQKGAEIAVNLGFEK